MFGGRGMTRWRTLSKTTPSDIAVYGSNNNSPSSHIDDSSNFSSTLITPKRKSSLASLLSFNERNKNQFSSTRYAFADDSDWVSVDAAAHGFCDCFVGPAPSEREVDDAVYSLQRVLGPASRAQLLMDDNESSHSGEVSEDDPQTDWVEPSLSPYNSNMLQASGSDRFYYAIHMLQTDPSVQRLVKSLSTDEAVWEAVVNNDVVQELRELISADFRSLGGNANDDPNNTTNFLMWVLKTARAKFMEVIEKINSIVTDLFQHAFHKTTAHTDDSGLFDDKLRTSFMLSIMVLLIVVVSRVHS